MKKLNQKLVDNLAKGAMHVTAATSVWGSDGCWLYFYEPKKPEALDRVTKEDLMKLVQK